MNQVNKVIFNECNLKDEEIDKEVVRVKAFIINSKREVLVALSNGGFQLIGGHVENGEQQTDTLRREIMEEAGISVSEEAFLSPFYEVSHYIRNYFNTSKNVISNIFYYVIRTDEKPNFENVKLTKREQSCDFKIKYIPYDEFKQFMEKFLNNEKEVNRIIAKETLAAFDKLESIL